MSLPTQPYRGAHTTEVLFITRRKPKFKLGSEIAKGFKQRLNSKLEAEPCQNEAMRKSKAKRFSL